MNHDSSRPDDSTYRPSTLSNIFIIFQKEFSSFFGANIPPAAIMITSIMAGLVSVLIALNEGLTYEAVTQALFYYFYLFVIGTSLALSMSGFVSERKQGTMELLYTLPVSEVELVLGKYLMGILTITILMSVMTFFYIGIIAEGPFYMILSGLFGLIIVGFYAYSVGLFASSLTESYILSLLISILIVMFIDIAGFLGGLFPSPIREILTHLHGINHFNPFTKGVIPLRSAVFFSSMSVLFLFLTVRVLESRRWRSGGI